MEYRRIQLYIFFVYELSGVIRKEVESLEWYDQLGHECKKFDSSRWHNFLSVYQGVEFLLDCTFQKP